MTRDVVSANGLAAELRAAFDAAFSQSPRTQVTPMEDFLAVRAGRTGYALPLSDVAGLFADKVITPVPGPVPAMLGIANFRGAIVPVYDLRALLVNTAGDRPRWLVLTATEPTVGLAFDHFDGHLRVPFDAVTAEDGAEAAPQADQRVVRTGDGVRAIVRAAAVLEAITRQIRHEPVNKERDT